VRPRASRSRAHGRAVATSFIAVAAGLALAISGCAAAPDADPAEAARPAETAPASPSPAASESAEPPAAKPAALGEGVAPARVAIPSIDLDESLVGLGVKADGTMGVPADWDAVGWFTEGGKPGGRGPTVIAGHVDSVTAPAVFHRLEELEVGDVVEVTDVDGALVRYAVTELLEVPKAEFPTVRVFGALPRDELRLITCGGFFDPDAASYEDNLVVFAERVA